MSFKSWIFKDPLYVNKFGMLEPKNSSKDIIPDLIMVPLVAFDKHLNRIGYGKGYYDRFLERTRACRIGVCFSSQIVESVPMEDHDIPMQGLVSEKGWQWIEEANSSF